MWKKYKRQIPHYRGLCFNRSIGISARDMLVCRQQDADVQTKGRSKSTETTVPSQSEIAKTIR